MNHKQRTKNRTTALMLRHNAHVCPECGERGLHWVSMGRSILDMLDGEPEVGFWTCPREYGPDGRRINP